MPVIVAFCILSSLCHLQKLIDAVDENIHFVKVKMSYVTVVVSDSQSDVIIAAAEVVGHTQHCRRYCDGEPSS